MVQWDQAIGVFVNLATGITSKSFTYSTGLAAGGTYSFMVMSRNSVGFSPLSSPITILVAQVPSAPSAPVTSISGANVLITWTAPYTGASRINSYSISVLASNGTYLADIAYCNGGSVIVVAS